MIPVKAGKTEPPIWPKTKTNAVFVRNLEEMKFAWLTDSGRLKFWWEDLCAY
jgi:hypothetical protein